MAEGLIGWWTRRFWRRRFATVDPHLPEINWSRHPLVKQLCIHPRVSGRPDHDWLDWLQSTYFPRPADRALSLGCGTGQSERRVVAMNLCRQLDACDLSPDAIAAAQAAAEKVGLAGRINFFVADLNALSLPEAAYDLILCSMSIHHVAALERFFTEARKALRPDGLLAANEFVGPTRFQWTAKQLRYANEVLQNLPLRYRRNLDPRGWRRRLAPYRKRVRRRPGWRMYLEDPSESVRSSEIIPLLEREFEIVERKDYGGTLLQLVLDRIAGNFQDTEEDRRVLRALCECEQELIDRGELSSDFAVLLARPRGSSSNIGHR